VSGRRRTSCLLFFSAQNWDYEQRPTNLRSFFPRVCPKHATPRHEPTMPAPHKQAKHIGVFARNPFDATTVHLTQFGPSQYGFLFAAGEATLLLSAPLPLPEPVGPPRTHGHISPKLWHAGHICQAVLGSYTHELKPPLGAPSQPPLGSGVVV
jgi:hypothetical protein